ncbi:MAG: peptidoglycan DD-metalloendopeptidase family protein [Bacteroidota bacterium]
MSIVLLVHSTNKMYRFGFNGQEKDDEVSGVGNTMTATFWEYDARLGRRWNLDPKVIVGISEYACFFNNPIFNTDIHGDIPIPLYDKFKIWGWRIDSWFGPRNTGLKGASKFHKGLDFNYKGGTDTDFGAPVLTTHNGTAKIDNDIAGQEGRSVTITSPDGSFRTIYMHLSEITIKDGAEINEGDIIGEIGGSANGSERGREVHLHYSIQKFNAKTGEWKSIDPTEGKGRSSKNIVDPQKWIKEDSSKKESKTIWNEFKDWINNNIFEKKKKNDIMDYIPVNPKTENKV